MGLFDGGGFDLGSLFQGGDFGVSTDLSLPAGLAAPDLPTTSGLSSLTMPDFFSATAPAAAALPATGGGGGWMDALSGIAKQVTPFAQLGLTGLGIGAGIQNMRTGAQQQDILQKAQKQQQQTAQPAATAGSELTAAGTSAMLGGPLPPELESQVQQKIAEMRAQLRSYFAHAGIGDSSMMAEYEGWINMQEQALRSQLAQNLLQSGYGGIGTALGATSALERSAAGQQQGINQTLAQANQAIAQLTGSQGKPQDQQSA